METLDKHFRNLTREAFARHGFAQAELVSNWADIVGTELAEVALPERIKWPRSPGATLSGGTLHLRVAPGRALEVSYAAPRIIERANAFLGFGAITAVKAVAAASWRESAAPPPPLPKNIPGEQRLATIEDDELRDALHRLGAGIAARGRSSPQGK